MIQSIGQIMAGTAQGSFSDEKRSFTIDGIKVIMTSRQADRMKQRMRAFKRGVKLSCAACDAYDIHPIKHLLQCSAAGRKKR